MNQDGWIFINENPHFIQISSAFVPGPHPRSHIHSATGHLRPGLGVPQASLVLGAGQLGTRPGTSLVFLRVSPGHIQGALSTPLVPVDADLGHLTEGVADSGPSSVDILLLSHLQRVLEALVVEVCVSQALTVGHRVGAPEDMAPTTRQHVLFRSWPRPGSGMASV